MNKLLDYIMNGKLNGVKNIIKNNPEIFNEYDYTLDINPLLATVKYYNKYLDDTSILEYILSKMPNKDYIFIKDNNSKYVFDIAFYNESLSVLEVLYRYINDEERLKIINIINSNNSNYINVKLFNKLKYNN